MDHPCLPSAGSRAANLVYDSVAIPMKKIHPDGLYTAGLKSESPDYRIEIEHCGAAARP